MQVLFTLEPKSIPCSRFNFLCETICQLSSTVVIRPLHKNTRKDFHDEMTTKAKPILVYTLP